MRYSLLGLVLATLTSTFAFAASGTPMDEIAYTKHNFAIGPYASVLATDGAGHAVTMCQPCHTPHHAIVDANISTVLWNHAISTATYTLYDGNSYGYTAGTPDTQAMDQVSRLCLSCHDGTVALDAFGTKANNYSRVGTSGAMMSASDVNNLGTDFKDDHPVGALAVYVTSAGVLKDGYKAPAAGTDAGAYGTSVKNSAGTSVSLQKMATNGNLVVGCKTCHNPHGKGLSSGNPFPYLLRTAPVDLCLTCHYK